MRRARRQSGFTLPELMVAGLVSMLVVFPTLALLFKAVEVNRDAQARLDANAQARQVLRVLGSGARPGGGGGTDGTGVVYGLRGRNAPYAPPLRQDYRFRLAGNGLEIAGDTFAQVTITCTGIGRPLPDCPGASAQRTLTGWVGADIGVSTSPRSVVGRTAEVRLPITAPTAARTAPGGRTVVDEYRTIFTLLREIPD